VFQFRSTGCPAEVWPVLTTRESTSKFLFGVSLESSWGAGSSVTGLLDGAPVMHGEVLFAAYPNRLTYVLSSGPEQPDVYITWEISGCGTGSIVHLSVVESDDSDNEELEAVWQPVVMALQALLSPQPA